MKYFHQIELEILVKDEFHQMYEFYVIDGNVHDIHNIFDNNFLDIENIDHED
jgi:hypothetical protein